MASQHSLTGGAAASVSPCGSASLCFPKEHPDTTTNTIFEMQVGVPLLVPGSNAPNPNLPLRWPVALQVPRALIFVYKILIYLDFRAKLQMKHPLLRKYYHPHGLREIPMK